MAPASAATLLPAAAAALMAMAALLLLPAAAAAAAPPPAPAPIGQPGCDTTCGNVRVPYPFGFGPSHCYWPGLNLTCNTSDPHQPPRLLLGDGSLRVTAISIDNSTVRVVRTGSIINTTGDFNPDGWNASFGGGFTEHGYQLSMGNELVVSGCNVVAMLLADFAEQKTQTIMGGCASLCTVVDYGDGRGPMDMGRDPAGATGDASNYKFCSREVGSRCCQAPFTRSSMPRVVQAKWIPGGNHSLDQQLQPVNVFVAEEGWVDRTGLVGADDLQEAPFLLDWGIKRNVPQDVMHNYNCSQEVNDMICKSKHSVCNIDDEQQGYKCSCEDGYEGNPYLADGCQDKDECLLTSEENRCFGECTNTNGSYYCRCPHGSYGNPGIQGGCVLYNSTIAADVALPTVAPVKIGLIPNCSTSCGGVQVPYPFGISAGCYWPGFHLTCDTSRNPPRLLLDSNGTLQVIGISLRDSTVRVIQDTRLPDLFDPEDTSTFYFRMPDNRLELPDIGDSFTLSTRNEFLLFGHGVATLLGDNRNGTRSITAASCVSSIVPTPNHGRGSHCSGSDGCCRAPILAGSIPRKVEYKLVGNNEMDESQLAFISEDGLTDQWYMILNRSNYSVPRGYLSSPLVLQWVLKQDLPAPSANNSGQCPPDVARRLCQSDNSGCRQEINGGFTCHCSKGYDGNPYVNDGCKDIDECNDSAVPKPCLWGYCNNLPGHYECRCAPGMHGNASEQGGCVVNKSPPGLVIGLSVAGGQALLLMVLGILFLLRKFKQRKIKVQKQKYFKQNRGQLLQQLLSQKADIAERMIITLDELAKATNNFDKAREIGRGGHGTVYKGILSDLHVVAIKKSKITLKKEKDEFINEVAILSQINHKNVVKLFGCCLETEVPLLVYEFIPNGTLSDHLHTEKPKRSLSWSHRLRIATEIATSLAYLHSSVSIPIIHRDIKSSNILLDDTMTSKISDFGASRYNPIDKTGLTTRIQGTHGYLDPECFHTGRLTEKSDVYSFGVILVELLTREKPTSSHLSNEYGGLVPHFLNLLASRNLDQIMDPQVLEEGGNQVQEVAMLAASCINLRGEERPTMRQVELTLEGLQQGSNKKYKNNDIVTKEFDNAIIGANYSSWTNEGHKFEESSRRYSLEQEMMISARYPR